MNELESKQILNAQETKVLEFEKTMCVDLSLPRHNSEIQKLDTHFIALLKSDHGNARFRSEGSTFLGGEFQKDSITFIPAGRTVEWDIVLPMDVVNIFLKQEDVQAAADLIYDGKHKVSEGREFFGVHDSVATKLTTLLNNELKNFNLEFRLYVDSLLQALCFRIAKNQFQSSEKKIKSNLNRIMTKAQRDRSRDFLMESLYSNPSLLEISKEVGVSPFHFARGFKEYFGVPPHQYLMNLKLIHAIESIKNQKHSNTFIAHQLGFSSQSHFNKAFKKNLGLNPSRLKP